MEFQCEGGPLNGQPLLRRESHGSKGVLLVDRPANQCWLYDWDAAASLFRVRGDAMPVHTEGPDNRYRAAEQSEFDVVAAPWVVSDGD